MRNKASLEDAVAGKGVHVDSDNRISWDEDADQHPRNWNFGTKTYTAALICWLEMYMTAISSSGHLLLAHLRGLRTTNHIYHCSNNLLYILGDSGCGAVNNWRILRSVLPRRGCSNPSDCGFWQL
ncbi:hypothetical protein LB505_013360 [Fusarium chuoi]|nr:hypothetical protein LB505_013360 [Fusarium chuoi]